MKEKFELGIEVSEEVLKSKVPHKINRYLEEEKKTIEVSDIKSEKSYRYRPGVNFSMIGDLDA